LATIENQSAGTTEEFKYDENGNVIMHWNPTDGEKNMFWDEQDRMKAFYSNETGTFQYYTYDDKGERIIKYNLKEGAKLFQNGALVDGQMEMIGYKLYPNAY
jgi:YD repeat-containing protein